LEDHLLERKRIESKRNNIESQLKGVKVKHEEDLRKFQSEFPQEYNSIAQKVPTHALQEKMDKYDHAVKAGEELKYKLREAISELQNQVLELYI